MRKVFIAFAALALLAGVALAGDPNVDGKFQAFGNARLVNGGVGPDDESVDLTSDCTPTTPAPAAFTCNFSTLTFSGVAFVPNANHSPTLGDISTLSTDYNVGGSNCGGGSPRFEIDYATGGNIFVYIGPFPEFTDCFFGWQNTGNVVTSTDHRWDCTQRIGGTPQRNFSDCLASAAGVPIQSISVVLDGGWTTRRGQDATIDNFTINNKVLKAHDAFHY